MYTIVYVCMYIYICVCVCMCVCPYDIAIYSHNISFSFLFGGSGYDCCITAMGVYAYRDLSFSLSCYSKRNPTDPQRVPLAT